MAVTYVDEIPIGFGLRSNTLAQQAMLIPALQPSSQKPKTYTEASIDREILGIENVAHILRCSVDKARRISRHELPARKGPGKALLYLRSDVLDFVRNLPTTDNELEVLVDEEPYHRGGFDITAAKRRISGK